MGKAEEYRARKRTKAARKRLSNTVDFTRGTQAAKRRHKAGRRRICEGMCFSLPTPDDPFNDLYKEKIVKKDQEHGSNISNLGSKEFLKIESHKTKSKARPHKAKGSILSANFDKAKKPGSVVVTQRSEGKDTDDSLKKFVTDGFVNYVSRNDQENTLQWSTTSYRFKWKPSCERCVKKDGSWTCVGEDAFETSLCALLNASILTDEQLGNNCVGEVITKSEVFMGNKWDWQFWEACGTGSDVLATGRAATTMTLAVSVLAAVAHIGTRRVHQILSSSPVVLFIVQSKEQTLQVRSIFKVLKPLLGLHSVSLHTGTSLQHQIEGLRSTPAEILVATPDRLCDLLSVNAVSLSNVSFMVFDGLEGIIACGFGDQMVRIRGKVGDNVQLVLSSGNIPHSLYTICQKLLKEPICRVMLDTSFPKCSAWISQIVQVLLSENGRQQKLRKIVRDHFDNPENGALHRGLLVLFRQSKSLLKVKAAMEEEGYAADSFVSDSISKDHVLEQFRNGQVEVLLSTEAFIGQIDLAGLGIIIYYEFPSTMDLYCQTLTRMARNVAKGILYSFCCGAMAPLALKLIEVLEQCFQRVPTSLTMLAKAATLVEQKNTG